MITFKFVVFLLGLFIFLYGLEGLINVMSKLSLIQGSILIISLVISLSFFIGLLTGIITYEM